MGWRPHGGGMLGRPGLLALLALLLLAAPIAPARPFVTWDDVGVATQGSVEEWRDALADMSPCPDAELDVRVTLHLEAGGFGDVLALRFPDTPEHEVAYARFGAPAVLDGAFPTGCSGRFFVEGASVEHAAVYRWHVQPR